MCPFRADESIDEDGLRAYIGQLAVPGLKGLTCNDHTGEIMALRHSERPRVTRTVAEVARGRQKVVSGVAAEGSLEAIDDALAAKEAGADAILLMPPHEWLRFGRPSATAIGFIEDVASGADVPIIVQLTHAALNGDLTGARQAQRLVEPLTRIVYAFGEPSGSVHRRMKCARWLLGQFTSPQMRRPLRTLPAEEVRHIRDGLEEIGYAACGRAMHNTYRVKRSARGAPVPDRVSELPQRVSGWRRGARGEMLLENSAQCWGSTRE